MTDFQPILLFPVRDAFARKQFLIAALLMLAGTIVPLLPTLILMGYGARIMHQIIDEDREPSMLEWQGSDWSQLLREGARLFAVRIIFTLPTLLLFGCGLLFIMTSPFLLTPSSNGDPNSLAPLGGVSIITGIAIFLVAMILSLPLGILIGAAESHAVTKRSFQAALQVHEWWQIFRASLAYFLGAYLFTIIAGFILSVVVQIAMITIVLICIVPFLMFGYSAYLMLVMNALFAQAYATGRKAIQTV